MRPSIGPTPAKDGVPTLSGAIDRLVSLPPTVHDGEAEGKQTEGEKTIDGECVTDDQDASDTTEQLEPKADALQGQEYPRERS